MDVVVVDQKGRAVTGLRAQDFKITEDGAPQSVASFEAVALVSRATAGSTDSQATLPSERRSPRPFFAVVFDDLNITPFRANQARTAVEEFLGRDVLEGDRITLLNTSGSVRWDGESSLASTLAQSIARLGPGLTPDMSPDRIADHEAMQIHIFRDRDVTERVERRLAQRAGAMAPFSVAAQAAEVYQRAAARVESTLDAIEKQLGTMTSETGRKAMILVSEGFFGDPRSDAPKRVVLAAMRANVAVYFVDARGLELGSTGYPTEFNSLLDAKYVAATLADEANATHGTEILADETGGFTIRNTNNLSAGMKRIAEEASTYYLVGYSPTNPRCDRRFRKIRVKVAGKGLRVRARKGYYALP